MFITLTFVANQWGGLQSVDNPTNWTTYKENPRLGTIYKKMFEISIYEFLLIKLKLPQTGKIQKLIVEIVKSCLDFYDELKSFKAILKSCLFI